MQNAKKHRKKQLKSSKEIAQKIYAKIVKIVEGTQTRLKPSNAKSLKTCTIVECKMLKNAQNRLMQNAKNR